MKSTLLGKYVDYYTGALLRSVTEDMFADGPLFVIGVKGKLRDTYTRDLDIFLKVHPNVEVVERFPEVSNPKYISENGHKLQPAFINWKKETPK